MKCPLCEIEMRITDRDGVEIDHCPQCRGVWLDRGELEKIVARETRAADDEYDSHDDEHRPRRGRERCEDHDDRRYQGRKREGFWANVMDIFD